MHSDMFFIFMNPNKLGMGDIATIIYIINYFYHQPFPDDLHDIPTRIIFHSYSPFIFLEKNTFPIYFSDGSVGSAGCITSCQDAACGSGEVGIPFWTGRCNASRNALRASLLERAFGGSQVPSFYGSNPRSMSDG